MDRIANALHSTLVRRFLKYKDNKERNIRIIWQPTPYSPFDINITRPSSTLVASYNRAVAEDLSACFAAQLNDTPAHRVRDRVNAVFRASIKVMIPSDLGGGLDKEATKKVLAWMVEYWDDDNQTTVDLGTQQPLVDAFQQLRVAKVLGVLQLEYTLEQTINLVLSSILQTFEVASVTKAFGSNSEEVDRIIENVARAWLNEHILTNDDHRKRLDDHKALMSESPEYDEAVKIDGVATLIANMVNKHDRYDQFTSSEEYRELWEKSAVFRQAIDENWA